MLGELFERLKRLGEGRAKQAAGLMRARRARFASRQAHNSCPSGLFCCTADVFLQAVLHLFQQLDCIGSRKDAEAAQRSFKDNSTGSG